MAGTNVRLPRPVDRWRIAARLIAIVGVAFVIWSVALLLPGLAHSKWSASAWADVIGLLLGAIFVVGFAAGLLWLSWRLWFRWNATTVRWTVGVLLVFLLITIFSMLIPVGTAPFESPWKDGSEVVGLIVAAVIYRWLIRRVIRSAKLDEPTDIYGQAIGHMGRVRAFGTVLGWMIWLAGSNAARSKLGHHGPPGWQDGLAVFGPILAGWGTYRLLVWWMKPRTIRAQPAGGFEVLPIAPANANIKIGSV